MPTYVVKIERTSYEIVEARDEEHALRRGLAVASAGRNREDFRAVSATEADNNEDKD